MTDIIFPRYAFNNKFKLHDEISQFSIKCIKCNSYGYHPDEGFYYKSMKLSDFPKYKYLILNCLGLKFSSGA